MRGRIGGRLVPVSGELAADAGPLAQRGRAARPSPDVEDRAGVGADRRQLADQELEEVLGVEEIAHLLAGAAEARVAQRAPEVMAGDPEREDALVLAAELPRPCDHAAAVDQRGEARA